MNKWRVRCSVEQLCCSGVLVATNRMFGLMTASQIASTSVHIRPSGRLAASGVRQRGAGFDTDQAWRQLLEEGYHGAALDLATQDGIALRINPVNLKNRLRDVEIDCCGRLHGSSRIVGALNSTHIHGTHVPGGGAAHSVIKGIMHRSKNIRQHELPPLERTRLWPGWLWAEGLRRVPLRSARSTPDQQIGWKVMVSQRP
jgi:hypothetical protein